MFQSERGNVRQWTKTWAKTMPRYRLVSLTETADDVVEALERTQLQEMTENDPPEATLKRPAAQMKEPTGYKLKRPAMAMKKAAKTPVKAAKAKTKTTKAKTKTTKAKAKTKTTKASRRGPRVAF